MPERFVERQAEAAELAPVLGATTDRRVNSDNARGLMITVLGEFVRPNGGSAWTQTLIEAMELVGVQDKATRQVLARLADRGWLDRSKAGRRTHWHLTASSRALLETGADRIYGFGRSEQRWDGRWLVVLASLPDREASQRYRLTTGLAWAGFGSLGQGTWISPWVEHERQCAAVLTDLDVAGATTFRSEIGALGHGDELAARAWDLAELRSHYDTFLGTVEQIERANAPRGAEAVAGLINLVHAWRRFPFLDPELPSELLPHDWPAPYAVARFEQLRSALLDAATTWWRDSDARYASTVA
ncbi:MAG: PaaX family transcriptional regulator C-terminal domain-containing protein [Ilumatobacter sp.]